jgi:hypothetical protein
MQGQETWEKIKEQIDVAVMNAEKYYRDNNKSAGMRARSALDKIANLKVQWRKETK